MLWCLCLQYKPSRWWFEFALLYNKIFFVLLSILLNSDERAWHLLGSLISITVATLALVDGTACGESAGKPLRSRNAATPYDHSIRIRFYAVLGGKFIIKQFGF